MSPRKPVARLTLGLLACLACTAAASLQDTPDTAPDASPGPAMNRDAILERLNRRLEQTDAARLRLEAMISAIESGTPLVEAIDPEDRQLLGFHRPGRDRRGGPPQSPRRDGPSSGSGPQPAPGDVMPAQTEERLERIRAIIDEHMPEVAERLRIAEQENPEYAERFFRRMAPRFSDIIELEENAPELVPVRIEELRTGLAIVTAGRELRRLGREDRESEAFLAKKLEIRELLVHQLELRHRLESHRLEMMEQEIERARAKLRKQEENKNELIDRDLERVIERTMSDRPWRERSRRRDRD